MQLFTWIYLFQVKTETVYVAHSWVIIFIGACFSYLTAKCFIAVYGMAIDTIFLCFCEDSARNDGITRPYYMSKGMMEFVENSDKALAALEKRKESRKENNEVTTIYLQVERPIIFLFSGDGDGEAAVRLIILYWWLWLMPQQTG